MNINVLAGMKCPKCGQREPFQIVVTCFATVYDDGILDTDDFDWSGDSYCRCLGCDFRGKVRNFLKELKKKKEV